MDDGIQREIIEIVSNLTKIHQENIDPTMNFTAIGIDSFALAEIVYAVENHFEVTIPQDSLTNVHTISDLTVLIQKLLKDRG